MKKLDYQSVEISVVDYSKRIINYAKVTLKLLLKNEKKIISLKFDKQWQSYHVEQVKQGIYLLRVEASGYEPDERKVRVGAGILKEIFVLGKKGMPFYFRGKVKVPFEPKFNLLGVSVKPDLLEKEEQELTKHAAKFKLKQEKVGKSILEDNVRVFKFPVNTSEATRQRIQQRLSEHKLVRIVGPVVHIENESVSFLTNELIVKFKVDISREEIYKTAKEYGLNIIRSIPYAGNAYIMRAAKASYDILKVCDEIVKTDLVDYAEPNLVITAVDLQINPTDFQYAQQWHIPLIDLPLSWDILRNANPVGIMPGDPGDLTYGSENIIIAVMDRGIQSHTAGGITTATHPDFNGTITSGNNKVCKFYDFANMVSNNDAPPNDHGMGCAGVAAALANNPSVVVGEEEGVAGAAPNCRVMGLIRPSGGTTVQYTDAYTWMAGFDPGWTADGVNYPIGTAFPDIITPGADIVTNSFIMPSGGLMEDCFNFLTTFGRNGKGIPIFVAAGNSNINVAIDNPMAAYEKVIAIAASTDGEVKAGYSSFGNAIDVCAPSNGGTSGITTCDLVGGGNVVGHTGGGNDYRNNFGGTSSATPLAAGVAALMLSINSDLNWVQVRHILSKTAVKIDAANIDPTGQWIDTDGDGNIDFSQWYGFGRIDAQAAVQEAQNLIGIDPLTYIDTWIKENSTDIGDVPCLPPYSPDIWVRNTDPALDNPADMNVHQSPVRGQDNWVYANIRNRGAMDSLDVYVRISITRWAGTQYVYPDDFKPIGSPSTYPPATMAPGTYLIGEEHITSIPAGGFVTINMRWPADIIPPDTVVIDGLIYSWADSCLLVEVSPHDGPAPTGNHSWDNNNLCQRNITIVDAGDTDDMAIAFVVGNQVNEANMVNIRVERKNLPAGVKLYLDYIDRGTAKDVAKFLVEAEEETQVLDTCDLILMSQTKGKLYCHNTDETSLILIPPKTRFSFPCCNLRGKTTKYQIKPIDMDKRLIFALPTAQKARIPILRKQREYQVVALLVKGLRKLKKGEYQIDVYQEDLKRNMEGGVNFIIRKK
ncbi:MAG: hypothetical protein EPN82_05940 [Bacteroidetes bacterium]|nr:MAG: hypothetical protein EPN82_05940 [Bacteroidota bacterium]